MGARSRRMGSGTLEYTGPSTRSATQAKKKAMEMQANEMSMEYLAQVAADRLEPQVVTAKMGEDKLMSKDGEGKQGAEERSDIESGTDSNAQEKLNVQCLINQAPHEDETREKAAAAVAAAKGGEDKVIVHEVPGPPEAGDAFDEKPDENTVANETKVKDEECSSGVEEAAQKQEQQRCRRPRKRKGMNKCANQPSNKRGKHVEIEASTGHNRKHYPFIIPHDLDVDGDGEPPAAAAKLRRAKAASVATAAGARKTSDGHVRVSVNSFTIPELYVDIPDSATVGTLKRAVMDAAMKLLGGGLKVCVLLQGRKVPDEAATLSQVGISQDGNTDLGFMLEPTQVPSSSENDPLLILLKAADQPNSNSRCPPTFVLPEWTQQVTSQEAEPPQLYVQPPDGLCPPAPAAVAEAGPWEINNNGLVPESAAAPGTAAKDNDEQTKNESDTSTLSQATPCKPRMFDGKAIIVHPGIGVAGVDNSNGALVPIRPKTLDIHKRRMRRPFSVAEVESLVHAVEQLGTGRWRDVKLKAFENAKHRTYVDLKDKWKTLVHTAQIAPHQRRGDPVPQELLDRVVAANNYWTAHQAKEQAELEA